MVDDANRLPVPVETDGIVLGQGKAQAGGKLGQIAFRLGGDDFTAQLLQANMGKGLAGAAVINTISLDLYSHRLSIRPKRKSGVSLLASSRHYHAKTLFDIAHLNKLLAALVGGSQVLAQFAHGLGGLGPLGFG